MFERFTERARQVIVLAQQEARTLGHREIDTGHLLAGLAAEQEGLGARALKARGVTYTKVHDAVVEHYGGVVAARTDTKAQIPFTSRAQKVLELSLREALSLGHNYIGTEHVLLGLVREAPPEDYFVQVIGDPEELRNTILGILSGPGERQRREVERQRLGGAREFMARVKSQARGRTVVHSYTGTAKQLGEKVEELIDQRRMTQIEITIEKPPQRLGEQEDGSQEDDGEADGPEEQPEHQ